jgi:hypothetical protein
VKYYRNIAEKWLQQHAAPPHLKVEVEQIALHLRLLVHTVLLGDKQRRRRSGG